MSLVMMDLVLVVKCIYYDMAGHVTHVMHRIRAVSATESDGRMAHNAQHDQEHIHL